MKIILSIVSTNAVLLISVDSGAWRKSGSFGFAEGSACEEGNAKCATCAVAEIHFLVRWGVLFLLG
ncbi:MAG: hypothetical protein KKA81_08470 [Bacteroidetes bacterium]|nr:hypothetical protein [Bacteroidota bacterium]